MSPRAAHDAPFWCEENAWHFCADARLDGHACAVVVISNPDRCVALWHQRAASAPSRPVLWDYHVLVSSRDAEGAHWIWDLDTTLAFPCAASAWARATLRALPGVPAPRLRCIPAEFYRREFASDRRHMRAPDGTWLQPPPPWPAIGAGHRLDRLLSFDDDDFGPWLELDVLTARWRG